MAIWLPLILTVLLLLPGFAFYMFEVTSMAAGASAAAILILLSYGIGLLGENGSAGLTSWVTTTPVLALGIAAHLIVAISITGEGDLIRALQSSAPLLAFFLAGRVIATQIPFYSDDVLDRTMFALCALFFGIALMSIAGIQPESSRGVLAKSVFPFTEPSHFAFSAIIPIVYCCFRARLPLRLAILIAFMCAGYVLQSLSLVVGVIMAAVLTLPILWLVFGLTVIAPIVLSLDIGYFTDRLDFSASATNISSLIFIQGWELANDSLSRSFGWGIGFQQLGTVTINSAAANLLHRILNEDYNIYDGGITAAKYVAEFGIFGLIFVTTTVYFACKSAVYLRYRSDDGAINGYHVFFCSSIIGYMLELFVRGGGYFTATGLLALSALFYFDRMRRASDTGTR
jgi:hypothetical protein